MRLRSVAGTTTRCAVTALCTTVIPVPSAVAQARCSQPAAEAIVHIELPGHPFTPIPTRDGCWIFVSLDNRKGEPPSGVAVLRRTAGKTMLERVVRTQRGPEGMVLTHDEKILIGAVDDRLVFLDVPRLISGARGSSAVLGYLRLPEYHGHLNEMKVDAPGAVNVNVTRDDRFLFETEEWAGRITVIDLAKARASGFSASAIVGTVSTGALPIALTFSPDERYLYSTSEAAATDWGWPAECKPEGQDPATARVQFPQGAVVVVDVSRAKTDPMNAVVAKVPAGCSPVRLVISPGGDVVYVTARNSNALMAFDTRKLVTDSSHALLGAVPVGVSPVGVEVADDGRKVVVANSNRFARGNVPGTLSVIDASMVSQGAAAVLGTLPAGGFPREIRVTDAGQTVLVTNFATKTLQLIDLSRAKLNAGGRELGIR